MARTDMDQLDDIDRRNVGSSRSVAESEKTAKAREARRINGLKQIMGTADGRLWMWQFLGQCGLFRVDFTANASKEAFQLGMRNAGMPIFAEIQKHCLEEYITMTKENSNA